MTKIDVDARGLSCPEPVLLTKKALMQAAEEYEILVDNPAAFGNVQRFLKKAGKHFTAEQRENDYRIAVKS